MLIAIVGSSKAGNDNLANALIHNYLSKLDPEKDTIVSGGGAGVDTLVALLCQELKFKLIEFKPDTLAWEGFKKRNLQIAEKAERVVSFAYPLRNQKWHSTKCYHCANAGRDDNHEKTAGCYTGMKNGNYEVVIIS